MGAGLGPAANEPSLVDAPSENSEAEEPIENSETEATANPAESIAEVEPQASPQNAEEIIITSFAESLFRRAQLLAPSDRSQFVVAVALAQRGALGQAKAMLAKIAPEKGHGYVPAHAMLAQLLIFELQRQPAPKSRELAEELMHHAEQSKQWDRVPRPILLAASDLNVMVDNLPGAFQLLTIAAERFPEDNFALAQLAKHMHDEDNFGDARGTAEGLLKSELDADPNNTFVRLRLAQLYAMDEDLDRAEHVLLDVPEQERNAELKRMLSNIYVTRCKLSLTEGNGKFSVDYQFLLDALHVDSSNPLIDQEVARLLRMQGPRPPQELITHLLESLAAGTVSAPTHAYIAEVYLMRPDFAKAIPHLEKVVERSPNATEYLNNLAYCLAELHPERCEEALGFSLRAIELSKQKPRSDYYDTLSYVLSRLDRHLEAVTAIESAIELDPNRHEYHTRAAAEYRHLNNESMATAHERRAQQLQEAPPVAEEPQDELSPNTESDVSPADAEESASTADSSVPEPGAVENETSD